MLKGSSNFCEVGDLHEMGAELEQQGFRSGSGGTAGAPPRPQGQGEAAMTMGTQLQETLSLLQISLLEMLVDKIFDVAFLPALNSKGALMPHLC